MKNNDKLSKAKQESKPKTHWVLWTLAGAFIFLSMAAMFAADYYYAPGSDNPGALLDAAEK